MAEALFRKRAVIVSPTGVADVDLSGRRLGEFVLRERIDEGGCGAVYRCEQPGLDREAVIKIPRQELRDGAVAIERFKREAKLASRLDHPYAAHVYAFGTEEEDGLRWIAMELVHGVTLSQWLRDRGPMSLEQFVPFFERVAQVVQAAHERGIVHRDLKPSNIMVIERAGELLPKLLDFGIAKLLGDAAVRKSPPSSAASMPQDPGATAQLRRRPANAAPAGDAIRLTRSSATVGSPQYMAPEQWTDPMAVGPRSDLYALGVIAYEALTGRRPFDAQTAEGLREQHLGAPVPSVAGTDLPQALDRVFARAMAKRQADRWGSALELAAALCAEADARLVAQIRTSARQWDDRGRPRDLLWRGSVLAELERWDRRTTTAREGLTATEIEFVEASHNLAAEESEARDRRARRSAWVQRAGVLLGLAVITSLFELRARLAQQDEETAKKVAEATAITAEVEQGRAALQHDDLVEAQKHLAEADRRGDHSPPTQFMLARAKQPLRAELATFSASNGRMWSAAWSRDGARIVITDDSAAQIWDVDAHQLIATLSHGDTVHQAMFSPNGAAVITVGNDGTVRLWRARDGAPIRQLSVRRAGNIPTHYFAAEMSPDGRLVAAIDTTGAVVHVWDAGTGVVLAELAGKGTDWASLAFSGDGRWLATGGGNDVQVFDVRTWTRATTIAGPRIRSVAWEPSGSRLVTGSDAGDASIWAVPSGARIHHLREVGEQVDAVAWSPDGRLVVLAGRNGDEQVFDATSGQLTSQSNQLHDKILAVEFDPSSRLVAAAGTIGAVAISDAVTGMPVSLLEGPSKLVRTAHFDPSSRRVLGASWDGTARIWDASSPYLRWHAPTSRDDCGVVTSLEPDQRVVAIPCRERATRVWDTSRDTLLAELPAATPPADGLELVLPAVSAAGDMAAIASGNEVEIHELPGGRLLRTVRHSAAVSALAFSAAGHDLISGAVDGSLLVTRDRTEPLSLPAAPRGIDAVGILADGRVLAADARGRVRVVAVDRGSVLAELEAPSRIGLLRPSPAGNRLVGVPEKSATTPPVLWDLTSYQAVAQLKGHVGRVFGARWVAGDRVLTAGGDGAARMWDSAGAKLVEYNGSTRFLADAALSPEGNFVVGGGADGRLRFWDAVTGRSLWTTPAHIGAVVSIRYEGEDIVTRGVGGDVSRWRLSSKP